MFGVEENARCGFSRAAVFLSILFECGRNLSLNFVCFLSCTDRMKSILADTRNRESLAIKALTNCEISTYEFTLLAEPNRFIVFGRVMSMVHGEGVSYSTMWHKHETSCLSDDNWNDTFCIAVQMLQFIAIFVSSPRKLALIRNSFVSWRQPIRFGDSFVPLMPCQKNHLLLGLLM